MYSVRHFDTQFPNLGGSTFDKEEVRELEALNQDSYRSIDAIILGEGGGAIRSDLLRQGHRKPASVPWPTACSATV